MIGKERNAMDISAGDSEMIDETFFPGSGRRLCHVPFIAKGRRGYSIPW